MKLEKMFPLIYYINLDSRKDRRKLAENEFNKLGISPKRFSAIKNDVPWMGCLQSHLTILKEAQKSKKSVIVFEDDVEFIGNYKEVIEKSLNELSKFNWDLFYLGGNVLKDIYQETEHLGRLQHCQSTHAIAYSYKALEYLIPFLEANTYILDVLLADYVIPYTNCYITIPMTAIQRTSFSNIENKEMTYDIPIARFNQHLIRKLRYDRQ
jgi:GR25 family glycosyltransferase involved in LPS biosynthesis